MPDEVHPDILAAIAKVRGKRPRAVIEHILQHGQVTTQELHDVYSYNHPPRAARDVREAGIPLETIRVRGSDGRMIGAYVFGDPSEVRMRRLDGRRTFPKALKQHLVEDSGGRCAICSTVYESPFLQIDHRVPYEVAGDAETQGEIRDHFQLLCASCQRRKSWSCEHCVNWSEQQAPAVCLTCYWASPERYEHIACRAERRLTLVFRGDKEIRIYGSLETEAKRRRKSLSGFVKQVVERFARKSLK